MVGESLIPIASVNMTYCFKNKGEGIFMKEKILHLLLKIV
jgi:hypothetical protein